MRKEKWTKKEFVFLFLVTAISAFFRLYQVDKIPPGLHGDEAWTGIDALRILKEGWAGPYVGSGLGQPSGPLYWTAFIFEIFGASLFTLRASMALLGILTIPALYFLAKTLFNRRVAVFASIFLTFSFWHLHFSRIAFMLISVPLIECLVLIFLFRALHMSSNLNWVVAGILAGLGFYSYNTYPFFLIAVGLTLTFTFWKEDNKRRLLSSLFVFAASFFLVAFPLINFSVNPKSGYFSHHQTVSVFNNPDYQKAERKIDKVQFLAKRLIQAILIFNSSNQTDYADALGEKPLLDPITGILFLGGTIIALRKIKDERYFLLFAGLATAFLPVILSIGGANRRVITALPFVLILASLPAAKLWERRLGKFAIIAGCLFIAGYNLNYYFNDLASAPTTKWVFCYDLVKVIDHLKSFPQGSAYVYFFSSRWSYKYPTRQFLLSDLPGEDRSREFGHFSIERTNNQGVVYLLMSPYESLVDELQQMYPYGKYQECRDQDERFVFASYYLEPASF